MMRVWRAGFLLCAFFLFSAAQPAQASLQLCNRTSYVLYAAAGWKAGPDNVTQGWTRVVPGDCRQMLSAPLTAPAYFLYARSSQAHAGQARAWGGSFGLCVKDTDFSLKTPALAPSCASEDAFIVSFAPLNNHGMTSWTSTLTEDGIITSNDIARDFGLTRLLIDLGYRFTNRQGRDDALKKFRTRLKVTPDASPADLFDALETEAMKTTSPAGYSICNDTANLIWTALAFAVGKDTLTAGWWKVPPGGCAHALTQPLKLDRVYIHAESRNKPALVSGQNKFCITNITFQTMNAKNCAARGLNEAGFALTGTGGLLGYTAHIGEDGLEPPAPRQAGTPK